MQSNSMGKVFSPKNIRRYLVGGGLLYCVANTIGESCFLISYLEKNSGTHVGEFVICSGPSMSPTIRDGDLVIAERLCRYLILIARSANISNLSLQRTKFATRGHCWVLKSS